jgi:hypothetical protein
VDGRATQSIILVKKVDMDSMEGDGGAVVGGGGVDVEAESVSLCVITSLVFCNPRRLTK